VTFNKREIADKQKMGEINNIFLSYWKVPRSLFCLFSRKWGEQANPNLPIDDQRKSYYPTNNRTSMNNGRIRFALRVEPI